MRKNHLRANEQKVIAAAHLFTASAATRLVVSNKQPKLNIIDRFWRWLNEPRKVPFVLTYEEKREQVIRYLTLKFADYQLTTGEVGLFPLCEALNEVERLERNNQLEKYYNRNKRRIAG